MDYQAGFSVELSLTGGKKVYSQINSSFGNTAGFICVLGCNLMHTYHSDTSE